MYILDTVVSLNSLHLIKRAHINIFYDFTLYILVGTNSKK